MEIKNIESALGCLIKFIKCKKRNFYSIEIEKHVLINKIDIIQKIEESFQNKIF